MARRRARRAGKLGSKVGCVCTKNGMKLCRSRAGARPKFVGKCR